MKSKAFTMIELMIVVAIISFLAVIAVPQLFTYKARAYQAEVAMNLASLHTAEQAYYAQHGCYTTVLNGDNGLGWKPAGYRGGGKEENFYYTYGFNVPGAQEGVHYFTGKLSTPKESLSGTSAATDGFTARAAGNLLGGNKKHDIWQIDQTRRIDNIQKGLE